MNPVVSSPAAPIPPYRPKADVEKAPASRLMVLAAGATAPIGMGVVSGVASAYVGGLTLVGATASAHEVVRQSASLAWRGRWSDAATVAMRQGMEVGFGTLYGMTVSGALATVSATLLLTSPLTCVPSALISLAEQKL